MGRPINKQKKRRIKKVHRGGEWTTYEIYKPSDDLSIFASGTYNKLGRILLKFPPNILKDYKSALQSSPLSYVEMTRALRKALDTPLTPFAKSRSGAKPRVLSADEQKILEDTITFIRSAYHENENEKKLAALTPTEKQKKAYKNSISIQEQPKSKSKSKLETVNTVTIPNTEHNSYVPEVPPSEFSELHVDNKKGQDINEQKNEIRQKISVINEQLKVWFLGEDKRNQLTDRLEELSFLYGQIEKGKEIPQGWKIGGAKKRKHKKKTRGKTIRRPRKPKKTNKRKLKSKKSK
jgi:hypothetical protein